MNAMISVVVCTYNRADLLAVLLQCLCDQTLHKSHYEIIVVDNNSTDNTRAVVEGFSHYGNVRYCLETCIGLSFARNRGWQEAGGEYVAYSDDDCKIPEQWLSEARHIIERFAPAAFGGPVRPFFNTRKPVWYRAGSHEPLTEARFLRGNEYTLIFGGNSFFHRKLLQGLGGFDTTLGMSGDNIGYGEETALLRLIATAMPDQLYFDPRLYVYHLVQAKKMTWRYNVRASFAAGRASFRVNRHEVHQLRGRGQLLRHCIRTLLGLVLDSIRSGLYRDRTQYPYIQNYLYEHTLGYVRELGNIYEQFKGLAKHDKKYC